MSVPVDVRAALKAHYLARGIDEARANFLANQNAGKPLARLVGEAEKVLERLRDGASVQETAEEYGVTKQALYQWLLEHAPGEWAGISSAGALVQLEVADEIVMGAEDQVEVSKGGALARSAQWKLERLAPRLYSSKQDASGVQITVVVDRSCGVVGGSSIASVEGANGSPLPGEILED